MPDDSINQRAPAPLSTGAGGEAEWLACQMEAEAWIAPGGRLIEDAELRNRRVSAAYASLWLRDQRFQWAALAAFASRQVGCSLQHAAQSMQRLGGDIRASRTADSFEWLYKIMIPALVGTGAGFLRGQLSLGNLTVFLDAYPPHLFYARYGLERLRQTLPARQAIADRVHWPVAAQVLPFAKPFREMVDAFALIDAGRIGDSVFKLAYHEQVNVLQPVMYDDPKTRLALDANQIGDVAGLAPLDFETILLEFSNQCAAREGASTEFSKRPDAHLYDVGQRMEFVNRAAAQLDALLQSEQRPALVRALNDIRLCGEPQPQ
jgi:hypothetical protein